MLWAFLLVGGGVYGATLLQPRLYTATASIMINSAQERVVSPDQALSEPTPNSAVVDTEIEILRSPHLARQVVEDLDLQSAPLWNQALGAPSPLSRVLGWVTEAIPPAASTRTESPEPSPTQVGAIVSAVSKALTVSRRGLSYVIDISVEAGDPGQAAKVANGFVEAYLHSASSARLEAAENASAWLKGRVAALGEDVQRKDAAVAEYREAAGIPTAEEMALAEARVTAAQTAVLEARAELAASQTRLGQTQGAIQRSDSGGAFEDALKSDVVRDLRRQEAELAQRQAEYESTLGPRHPFVVNGRVELNEVRSRIDDEVGRIRQQVQGGLRTEASVARQRLATLEADLAAARASLAGDNQALVRLQELERDATAARDVYQSFLQRYHEVVDQGQMAETKARVVSLAQPPQAPSSPRENLGVALALAAGFVAAAMSYFAAGAFGGGILMTPEDVEFGVGVPALASIPTIGRRGLRLLAPTDRHPPGYLVDQPRSSFAEAIRVLRSSATPAGPDRQGRIVAFTSAFPREGKTSTALSVARAAALADLRVLIVDCDLRRRSLNRFLDIEPRAGLLQVLAGQKSWQEVTGIDEATGAHVLPLAESSFTTRDDVTSRAMGNLLKELRGAFDLIVLDTAPMFVAADARVLAAQVDGVVVVAKWKANIRAVATAVRQLRFSNGRVLGVALNQVDPRRLRWEAYSGRPYYDRIDYSADIA